MYNKNEHYNIAIDDIGVDGEGIGKLEGFTFFVDNALPGETVEMKVLKTKQNYGYGKLMNIIERSHYRKEPECESFPKCGGCTLQHLKYSEQMKLKTKTVKNCLERIGGFKNIAVNETIGMENPVNFRNKAQFPFGICEGEGIAGFYAGRSHRIVKIDDCMIVHPINKHILSVFKKFIAEYGISIYNETNQKGLLRHLLVRTSSVGDETMVCVVINGERLPHSGRLIEELTKIPEITSIMLNINKKNTNVILGSKCVTLWGKDHIEDELCGMKFRISPLSFFQTNHIQTERLYNCVLELGEIKPTDIVIDAYCGIGTISLAAAKRAAKVIGIEIVEDAVNDAVLNSKNNGIDNSEFICGKSEDVIPKLISGGLRPDLIITDPPRKGCDRALIDAIAASTANRLVYVSCDPATLARDLKILHEIGGFEIKTVQPVDMFPMGGHVETVVLLSRIDSKDAVTGGEV